MLRTIRFALTLAAVLTATRPARAQYGYGGGWRGWGASTPGSSMARGLGMMGMGAGMYNVSTAQARSINTNTAMRWNQAMFNGSRVGARMFAAREKALKQENEQSYSAIRDRIRNHPTSRDVTDGDALNAVLDVLLNPTNADALFWAMSYRCQPQHDLKILDRKDPGHGPRGPRDHGESASVLVNALLKGDFSPVALPKKEFMERARVIWERLGLPALKPETPWHGYDLGVWPPNLAHQADMAARSEYFDFADELVRQRRRDVSMNDPVPWTNK